MQPPGNKDPPNQALQQTGHAKEACSCHNANFRVSRLLSWLFGERRRNAVMADACSGDRPRANIGLCARLASTFSVPVNGVVTKMDEIQEEIELTGFDPKGEPVIRIMTDGSLLIVFNFMPPSFVPDGQELELGPFADFDKQLERATGMPVVWDDREVFVIQQPKPDTVKRIRKFLDSYRSK